MSRNGFQLAAWPQLILIACVLLAGCDGAGPSSLTSPDGKPGFDGGKPPPPPPPAPADPAIAFYKSAGGGTDLKVMNADGSNVATISHTAYNSLMYPSWSPDGGSIAFIKNPYPEGVGWDLMVIDVDVVSGVPTGSNLRVLVDRTWSLYSPAWSPSGGEIAFVDSNNRTIEVIPAGGGVSSVVYMSPAMPHSPTWSRDGTQIAFSELDGDTHVIRAVHLATGQVTTLLDADHARPITAGEWIETIDWARGQDVLAFTTGFNPRKIYTLATSSGTPTFLVEGQSPTWSPNDGQITFEGFQGNNSKLSRITLATGVIAQFGVTGTNPDRRRF